MSVQYGSLPLYYPVGRIFFLGDVHNEADKFMSVLDQLTPILTEDDHVVFLGDIIDRGPNAALTIETLVNFTTSRPLGTVFYVEGNHEEMLRDYLSRGSTQWLQYLNVTLLDLKAKWNLPDILPKTIADALIAHGFKEITSRTIPYYETEEVIGTHAPFDRVVVAVNGGMSYEDDYNDRANNSRFIHLLDRLRYEIKWQFTDESEDIPWIKKFRVCGHQAGRGSHPRIFSDRAFIDTASGLRESGKITCLTYPGKKYIQSQ